MYQHNKYDLLIFTLKHLKNKQTINKKKQSLKEIKKLKSPKSCYFLLPKALLDLRMLALIAAGLERRRKDAEGEEGVEELLGFNRVDGEGEVEGSWMILSRLTKTPCFSLHLK